MGLALLALAGLGLWRDWADFLTITFLSLAAIHLLLAFIAPRLLTGFNRFWMSLGYYFGKVFAPIEMALIFFIIFYIYVFKKIYCKILKCINIYSFFILIDLFYFFM
jgi:hypothetical protein